MGATLSLGWFTPQWFYFGHLGDSRVLSPREGPLAQITHDHSHVGWLRRQGRINEREARARIRGATPCSRRSAPATNSSIRTSARSRTGRAIVS